MRGKDLLVIKIAGGGPSRVPNGTGLDSPHRSSSPLALRVFLEIVNALLGNNGPIVAATGPESANALAAKNMNRKNSLRS
jgi:hypothetical protein